ncbi:MAG: two-component regulator propeller domain-containing protein [Prevotella sp.]
MNNLLTSILLLCSIYCMNVKADNGRLYSSDELSSSAVTTICQDRYGYIWIGTECGLDKFDGYHFTSFFSQSNDTTSISDNNISAIYVDKEGTLWIGTGKGLSRYNYHTNSFKRYTFPGNIVPRISSLAENRQGLLIGTAGYGLYSIRKGADIVCHDTPKLHGTYEDFYSRIHIDPQGHLWRGSHEPIVTRYKIDSNNRIVSKQDFNLPNGPAVSFVQKDEHTMYIVSLYGIMEYDETAGRLIDPGFDLTSLNERVSIRNAKYDKEGVLYVCTSGNGLMKIDRGSNKLIPAFIDDNILRTANANAILIDKDSNIWTSCYNKGIYKIDSSNYPFRCWNLSTHNIHTGSGVSSIAIGRNNDIWCAVQNNGLYVFDFDGRLLAHPNSPAGTGLVYCDRRGQFWLCTEKALYRYNPSTGDSKLELKFDGWGLNCMADDRQGRLYISNFGKGLCIYDTNSGEHRMVSMNQHASGKPQLWNDWISSLMIDDHDMLWIGTNKGISRMNTSSGEFYNFPGGCLLPDIRCTSLVQDEQGVVYAGTNSGLYRFSYKTNAMEQVAASSQLAGHDINCLYTESGGDVWMGTTNGIWLYDKKGDKLLGYVHGYGLNSREYRHGITARPEEGLLVFGTNNGITVFHTDEVRHVNISLGEVFLTDFVIGGRHADCLQDKFTIPYDESTFSMQFSLLDYRNVENITFEYRLSKNHGWTSIPEGTNTIYFNRMMPGQYKLEVRAVCNGTVSHSTKTMTLVVESPWYATTLAYLIYILIAMSVFAGLFLVYRRHKREELEEAKMQFLINATHDIRSPLTLIMEPLAKLKTIIGNNEGRDYIDTISHNAQRLLLLVNQILDERKIDKNQMRLLCSETEMVAYVKRAIKSYKFRAEQRDIKLVLDARIDQLQLWIDRIHFDKVISNLLSNAFKYTPNGGEIRIGISTDGKQGIITVSDTGIGLQEEKTERLFERFYQSKSSRVVNKAGTGIGLNLCRALVTLHGGKICAANREDGITGSVFTITLPLGNKHLKPEEIETATESEEQKKSANRQPSKNLRVLVVDDDEEIAQYIKNELSVYYRFTLCHNGKEGLKELLGDMHYDIVISDVMMPEMDGIQLLKQIKSNAKLSDVPVILLTSRAEVADRLEGLKRGADAFLAKPFSIEELHIQIDNIIDNIRRIRGKYSGKQDQADKVEAIKVEGNDDVLMKRIMKSINEHISDPEFNVERMSEEIGLSRAQLHRKMKEITGISSSEFIRNIRLEQAAKLICEGKINITQVAYAVGYNNQTHFSTVFKKHYGMSPTEYAAKNSENK